MSQCLGYNKLTETLSLLVPGSLQLVIKQVNIPQSVRVGEDSVILDCDYDLENTSTKGLVVKWYLNDYDLVYQWIYDTPPQAIDPVLKYIDHFKASDDPNTMYRAMRLTRPGIDLTGNYTCLISTFEDEVSAKRPMTVYCEFILSISLLLSRAQSSTEIARARARMLFRLIESLSV